MIGSAAQCGKHMLFQLLLPYLTGSHLWLSVRKHPWISTSVFGPRASCESRMYCADSHFILPFVRLNNNHHPMPSLSFFFELAAYFTSYSCCIMIACNKGDDRLTGAQPTSARFDCHQTLILWWQLFLLCSQTLEKDRVFFSFCFKKKKEKAFDLWKAKAIKIRDIVSICRMWVKAYKWSPACHKSGLLVTPALRHILY